MTDDPTSSPEDLADDEAAPLARVAERMHAEIDAYLIDRREPRLILGKCRHVFEGTPGRYLCDPCEAAGYE